MRAVLPSSILLFSSLVGLSVPAISQDRAPNIVIIVSDDAGYADFSMQGSTLMSTPHIDSIASNGIRFRQGYVSASVCSPSRAGLMTGRYQQRFGHENNIPPRYSETNGLPTDETMMSTVLQKVGYRTYGLGKWHLGYAPKFHPLSRGFDSFFGFLQGARSYFPIKKPTRLNRLLRDREVQQEKFEYMTDTLGLEAARYIDEHCAGEQAAKPFFMYLAFNAVHGPMHAKPSVLETVEDSENAKRRKLVAMTISLDDAVGTVLKALEKNKQVENTLLVFVNDNGGATNNASVNLPLRATKGTPYEGGIRVAFAVQWPGTLPKAVVYEHPVSTLDLLPTAIAACGETVVSKQPLDGVNLLPFLKGENEAAPHEALYWRRGDNKAVRKGDMKLVSYKKSDWQLYNIAEDEAESKDLAALRPEVVKSMAALYATWAQPMKASAWEYGKRRGAKKGGKKRGKKKR